MYMNGQTLKHKITNELVRLNPSESTFAWSVDYLIREDGSTFKPDNFNDYGPVYDELGRPTSGSPGPGQFVDENLKKYLVSDEELEKMKEERLISWESKILDRMDGITLSSCDISNKQVHCPFADGSRCYTFQKFFLERRNAKPLYKQYSLYKNNTDLIDGPLVFLHKGQTWSYDDHLSTLKVIILGDLSCFTK